MISPRGGRTKRRSCSQTLSRVVRRNGNRTTRSSGRGRRNPPARGWRESHSWPPPPADHMSRSVIWVETHHCALAHRGSSGPRGMCAPRERDLPSRCANPSGTDQGCDRCEFCRSWGWSPFHPHLGTPTYSFLPGRSLSVSAARGISGITRGDRETIVSPHMVLSLWTTTSSTFFFEQTLFDGLATLQVRVGWQCFIFVLSRSLPLRKHRAACVQLPPTPPLTDLLVPFASTATCWISAGRCARVTREERGYQVEAGKCVFRL